MRLSDLYFCVKSALIQKGAIIFMAPFAFVEFICGFILEYFLYYRLHPKHHSR